MEVVLARSLLTFCKQTYTNIVRHFVVIHVSGKIMTTATNVTGRLNSKMAGAKLEAKMNLTGYLTGWLLTLNFRLLVSFFGL